MWKSGVVDVCSLSGCVECPVIMVRDEGRKKSKRGKEEEGGIYDSHQRMHYPRTFRCDPRIPPQKDQDSGAGKLVSPILRLPNVYRLIPLAMLVPDRTAVSCIVPVLPWRGAPNRDAGGNRLLSLL